MKYLTPVKMSLLAFALSALSGCGVFSNPGEDGPATTPPALPPSTETGIAVTLRDFEQYVGEQVDMRVVGGDGVVTTVVRLEQLASADYRLELSDVPQKPNSFVDVIVDLNGNGEYDGPELDAIWRQDLPESRSVLFLGAEPSESVPEPAKPGGEFALNLSGFGNLKGQLFRLALINPAGQLTGLFTGTVTDDEFTVHLPQIVVNTQPYRISFFADASDNGKYDAPPNDAAWQLFATGEEDGIDLNFEYNEDFEDIDFER
jgi:hypothetical protein